MEITSCYRGSLYPLYSKAAELGEKKSCGTDGRELLARNQLRPSGPRRRKGKGIGFLMRPGSGSWRLYPVHAICGPETANAFAAVARGRRLTERPGGPVALPAAVPFPYALPGTSRH